MRIWSKRSSASYSMMSGFLKVVVLHDFFFFFFCGFSVRCKHGMNHQKDRVPHVADGLCQYAHQYNNKVLICKVIRLILYSLLWFVSVQNEHTDVAVLYYLQKCYEGGREVIVMPKTSASTDNPWIGLAKYAWSGWVWGGFTTSSVSIKWLEKRCDVLTVGQKTRRMAQVYVEENLCICLTQLTSDE